MALSELQFTTLFNGAFGAPLEELGLTLDTAGDAPVAKKGDKVVSLLVINDRGIEWQINGASIDVPFGVNGRDEKGDRAKANARQKLTTAIS
jgi:hypothetical protein